MPYDFSDIPESKSVSPLWNLTYGLAGLGLGNGTRACQFDFVRVEARLIMSIHPHPIAISIANFYIKNLCLIKLNLIACNQTITVYRNWVQLVKKLFELIFI